MGVHPLDEPTGSMTCEKHRTPPPSSLSSSRIMGVPVRPWKSRSKSQSRLAVTPTCQWSHEGLGRWRDNHGQLVVITKVPLLQTFEAERLALQKLGLTRLQELNLGCLVEIPKLETFPTQQPKKKTILLRKKAVTTNFFDNKEKEKGSNLPVFGVALSQCLANDRLRMQNFNVDSNLGTRTSQKDHCEEVLSILRIFPGNLLDIGGHRDSNSSDFRYLSPSMRQEIAVTRNSLPDIHFGELQVPLVVQTCIRFLKAKGLNTLGIFRVSGAQKRVRQLREDFDSNRLLILDDSTQPHDVAQLLKEYFRDLPEPLLTRALYHAFLCTQSISDAERRLKACRWLLYLLPIVHRDTLATLLAFLEKVSQYAEDVQKRDGSWVAGNKMNAHNLATVFGPNLLRPGRSSPDSPYSVHSAEKSQERVDMILTVRLLIENYRELFQVTTEDVDDIYLQFMLDDPDMLNAILSRRCDIITSVGVEETNRSNELFQAEKLNSGKAFAQNLKEEILVSRREPIMDLTDNANLNEDPNVKSRIRPLSFAKGETEKSGYYFKSERPQSKERSDYKSTERRPSGGSVKYNLYQQPFAVSAAFTINMQTKGSPSILPLEVIKSEQRSSPRTRRVPYGKTRHLTTPAYVTEETITHITIPPPRNSYRGAPGTTYNPSIQDTLDQSKFQETTERSRPRIMEVTKPIAVIPERWKRQEIIASEHVQL